MENIMYIAINKETGKLMIGAKGQAAFTSEATLGRSIGQAYSYEAQRAGVKPMDMYHIIEVTVKTEVFNADFLGYEIY